ncbi:thiamine kinase [Pantoea eucrina]|uniref:Thiamine kinase n=1 Tax=Pantoea eucrina TaxID=472693 RepID=A0ABU5LFK6_9GAMM|nr:thiamine kinase [Pantoea eucrina]MDZ7278734.1 thiamine kinase [Pantoea eucrina]
MHNPDPHLIQMLKHSWPTAQAAGHFFALPGLSGGSVRVEQADRTLLARRAPAQPIPFVDRQREYRVLRKMRGAALGPAPLAWRAPWLLQTWLPGDTLTPTQFTAQRAAVLTLVRKLHQQPLTGYRLHLGPLLLQYWQLCKGRHWRWQRQLGRLLAQGEPPPLRLAPLHMDIHPGNLIATPDGLRLIDWEYAADGDIALEVAALCAAADGDRAGWIGEYAQRANLNPTKLAQQVRRWQPWLRLLMASWYQLRAEQTQDALLQQLAQASWHDL